MDQILKRFPNLSRVKAENILKLQAESFQRIKKFAPQEARNYVLSVLNKHSDANYRRKFVRVFYGFEESDHFRGIALTNSVLWPIYKEMKFQNEIFKFWDRQNFLNKPNQ